jgi:hypothetical protein
MDPESMEQFEEQLSGLPLGSPPAGLRQAVMSGIDRELRAARWERRAASAAALLLVVGIALNISLAMVPARSPVSPARQAVAANGRLPLVETAEVVAEVTNAATGRRVARQLAAMRGRRLSDEEAAEIDAAVERTSDQGNKG